MSPEETPRKSFKRDYNMLELHDTADWKTARANYRRLVHHWHPDKYAHRPREKAHAQQQFIVLTKAYNSLRSFYRSNQRLPFEKIKPATQTHSEKAPKSRKSTQTRQAAQAFEHELLGRDKTTGSRARSSSFLSRKQFWIIAAFAMMAATVAISLKLDLNANQANIAKGKEVLRQAPSSDFMPSQSEIRRSQSRGAFVQPTQQ